MLRSIKKAFDIIKAEDAETAITVHTIRTWCKQGKIKCLTAGNKVLVDMQSLLDYIAIKTDNTEVTPLKYGNAWVVNMDELLLFVNGKKESKQ